MTPKSPRPGSRRDVARVLLALTLALALAALPAGAQHHDGPSLGTVDFPVSCSAPAQKSFNEAVALLHHMTYPQARQAFEKITASEPTCAMAYWGAAMTLFQPLWPTRPSPEALAHGWDLVQKAQAIQSTTPRERLFIDEAAAFFKDPAATDYWLRIRRWEEASRRTYDALPDDTEAAVFYALAHLATAPANSNARQNADESAAILEKVYRQHPDHPGAMHYLVHANDVPGRERELLDVTNKYAKIAPDNPHALHMPTHIYTRLGDWNAVIDGNLRAADAALRYPAGEHGELVWDEFPHAIEYLEYAYLQEGADEKAAEQLHRLQSTANLEPSFKTAFHLASTQARYALERHAWDDAVRIEPRTPDSLPWDRFPWPEATSRFARGLGAARLGNLAEARATITRLTELEAAAQKSGEDLFARNIRILRLELEAWSAEARSDHARARQTMQEAAALEAATPKHAVTPGPTLPAYELLGDLDMKQEKPADALDAYEQSLAMYPRRFNSLLGAARAASAKGDTARARERYATLLDVAAKDSRRASIQEARAFLGR